MAASGDDSIKPIAALRLARVLSDQGKADEALAQLGKINNDAFKAQVAEVRGDILQKSRARPKKRAMPIRRRRMPAACRAAPNSS